MNRSKNLNPANNLMQTERTFKRFTTGQRWEHGLLILTFTALLLTGLPQKYYNLWGHFLLPSPESMLIIRQIHRIFAVLLTLEVVYHLWVNLRLLLRRKLSADIFPTWKDVQDAFQMIKYLLFLTREKPEYGKYNFEQKFTYWFIFFGVGILVITGFVQWFPELFTRIFTGALIPAARLAHSSEAVATAVFIVLWHFYHVHFQRLNLSIFTGWLSEREMRLFHGMELKRLTGKLRKSAPAAATRPESDTPELGERV